MGHELEGENCIEQVMGFISYDRFISNVPVNARLLDFQQHFPVAYIDTFSSFAFTRSFLYTDEKLLFDYTIWVVVKFEIVLFQNMSPTIE